MSRSNFVVNVELSSVTFEASSRISFAGVLSTDADFTIGCTGTSGLVVEGSCYAFFATGLLVLILVLTFVAVEARSVGSINVRSRVAISFAR